MGFFDCDEPDHDCTDIEDEEVWEDTSTSNDNDENLDEHDGAIYDDENDIIYD